MVVVCFACIDIHRIISTSVQFRIHLTPSIWLAHPNRPKMVKLIWLTLTFTLLAGLIEANESPSCRDEEGNAVDWWIAYKFPQFAYKSGPLGTGYGYAYVTSKGQSSTKWVVSKKSIIDKSSIVLNSIAVTYSGRDGISHLFYNDAPPKEDNPNSGRAHAKGILIIDDNKLDSLWLTHSVS